MRHNTYKQIGTIENGTLRYSDKEAKEKFVAFMEKHNLKKFEVVFTIVDTPEYFQHKYFHGYILPVIAEGQGEKDLVYLKEYVLKQEYLFTPVNDLREIPSRHRSRARIIQREHVDEHGEVTVNIIGYVPSTTTLTFDEMKAFILWCEEIRDGLIDWQMPEEAIRYRRAAMNENIDQGEMFS